MLGFPLGMWSLRLRLRSGLRQSGRAFSARRVYGTAEPERLASWIRMWASPPPGRGISGTGSQNDGVASQDQLHYAKAAFPIQQTIAFSAERHGAICIRAL